VVSRKLRVIFLENFNVSSAQLIYPAADISEQISTAGKEASGTGCMKFMMNGALTLGTLDGANVEINQLVGNENMYLFGMNAEEAARSHRIGYNAAAIREHDPRIMQLTDQLINGFFNDCGCNFWGIYEALLRQNDEFLVLGDYASYMDVAEKMARDHANDGEWYRKSLVNIAKSGYFSSDRTIREYCEDIWNA
jgi:starch phosphorylase